jgi:uncharacterized protein
MKIVILSDSHGSFGVIQKIVTREEPFDLLIHLGDGVEDLLRLQKIKACNFDAVAGNNDPVDSYPAHVMLKLGGYRFFLTHGHHYRVNDNLNQLFAAAKKEKSAFVFYGHTHSFADRVFKGIRFLNPGTVCTYLNKSLTYLIVEITDRNLQIKKVDLSRNVLD